MLDNELQERFDKIVKACGYVSRRAFAQKAGINDVTFGAIFRRGSEPRFSTLQAILLANPSVSAEWLIRGEGEMFRAVGQTNVVELHQPKVADGGVAGVNHYHSVESPRLIEGLRGDVASLARQLDGLGKQLDGLNRQLDSKDSQIANLFDLLNALRAK